MNNHVIAVPAPARHMKASSESCLADSDVISSRSFIIYSTVETASAVAEELDGRIRLRSSKMSF